jgi:hypothetical protein
MVMIDPTTRRLVHCTRSYIQNHHPTRQHPYLDVPLPPPTRRRRRPAAQQEGHSGAIAFGFVDEEDLPAVPNDLPSLGEALYPNDDFASMATHVRTTIGGEVHFLTRRDFAAQVEYRKWAKKYSARKKRSAGAGCERRRWVWKHGRPAGREGKGKKVAGEKRDRDERGRFI